MGFIHINRTGWNWRTTPPWATHERFSNVAADEIVYPDCCCCKMRADETVATGDVAQASLVGSIEPLPMPSLERIAALNAEMQSIYTQTLAVSGIASRLASGTGPQVEGEGSREELNPCSSDNPREGK